MQKIVVITALLLMGNWAVSQTSGTSPGAAIPKQNTVHVDVSISQPNVEACLDATGVQLLLPENWIRLSPNPAKGFVSLNAGMLKTGERVTVLILDKAGHEMLRLRRQAGEGGLQAIINLSGFTSGSYFVHVIGETRSGVQQLIIL